jgi:hypothetical protein
LESGNVVNSSSTTKNKAHCTYYLIKESVKNQYQENKDEVDLDDITCDS